MKHSQKNMKLSMLLFLFGISQVFAKDIKWGIKKIPLRQGACIEGGKCDMNLDNSEEDQMMSDISPWLHRLMMRKNEKGRKKMEREIRKERKRKEKKRKEKIRKERKTKTKERKRSFKLPLFK